MQLEKSRLRFFLQSFFALSSSCAKHNFTYFFYSMLYYWEYLHENRVFVWKFLLLIHHSSLSWKQLQYPVQKVPIPSEQKNISRNWQTSKNISSCFHENFLISLVIKKEKGVNMRHTMKKKKKQACFKCLKISIWAWKIFYCYVDTLHSTLLAFILKKMYTKHFVYVCVCIVFFILSTGNISFSAKAALI